MAMIERGGASSFFVGGATYEVGAQVKIIAGGIVRKPVESSNGIAGFTTSYVAPTVECEALDGPAVSVAALRAIVGQTLQIMMNNGKSYILVNATQIEHPTAEIDSGKITGLKFVGDALNEILVTQ